MVHVRLGGDSHARESAGPKPEATTSSAAVDAKQVEGPDRTVGVTASVSGGGNEAAIMAAFAGDDVVAEFQRDKDAQVQESVEHVEEPSSLPGWGTWTNAKREPRYAQ